MSLYEELIQKRVEKESIKTILRCFDSGFTMEQLRIVSGVG